MCGPEIQILSHADLPTWAQLSILHSALEKTTCKQSMNFTPLPMHNPCGVTDT
jgi:hypothetical protein